MEKEKKPNEKKEAKNTIVKKRRKSIFGMLKGKLFCDDAIFNLAMRPA